MLNINAIRKDFPILNQKIYGKNLVYLDNAATTQKPQMVLDEITNFYQTSCSNINRGAYYLSQKATEKYTQARTTIAQFINASSEEIVFTRSSTEAINLIANGFKKILKPGDEILLTQMEHHSNIVPWYMLAKELDIKLKVIDVTDDGLLDLNHFKKLLNDKIKFAAFTHASNVLGTINPVKEMCAILSNLEIPTLIDGSQAAPHIKIDVKDLNADFYVFSGHKTYAPFGIGVLYAKAPWLQKLPVYQTGGDMITSVSFDEVTFAQNYQKFEAGTPNVSGALGLAKAIEYTSSIGFENMIKHEEDLHDYAWQELEKISFVKKFGPKDNKVSLISFIINNVHPHDVASIFDREGVAIRAGHLCAQPLVKRFNVSSFCRVSLSFYNNSHDVEMFIKSCHEVKKVFKL